MNLLYKLQNLPIDKQAHFLAGVAVTLTFAVADAAVSGLIVGLIVAIGKELKDKFGKHKGTVDFWDAGATVIGSVVAFLYSIVVS